MKVKFYAIALTGFLCSIWSYGQHIASPGQASMKANHWEKQARMYDPHEQSILEEKEVLPLDYGIPNAHPSGKTAGDVDPVTIGRASNIFSIIRGESNQIWASDQINSVAFIHRHDITVWGGSVVDNGRYRYDYSINGGTDWNTDLGVINPDYSLRSRYPNITGFLPDTSSNPFSADLLYVGATLSPATGWDGHVVGLVGMGEMVPDTEFYAYVGENALIPGGLCKMNDSIKELKLLPERICMNDGKIIHYTHILPVVCCLCGSAKIH